ncbi:hypothetical protein G6F46_010811 [Rhizopus delemar]|uniref:GH18 domain-containing protein n=3 Tax=Rhizopus TaxID=4842 RepID=I1CSM9_RHIO9|nr:hypothetical protein RO3G_16170 [Rhizopus delemar RA 99-880]KAG1452503.1 hypothetical protein G6F55_008646 [Rhizopus delemar]KAG1536625.1 hypothetical protein G6F51_010861 [Rhizopus arrhizus]KAG1493993.1 hypothetical protein G6F54_008192 [Rhizopus delemar]KAG1503646.1 hypothetical protein G6F53_010580 [Rhizopus delemar]|eukprot:EIE91459.1 hypothetical protein RO3G_16170 [Rhizopus delemar RA 99-880]
MRHILFTLLTLCVVFSYTALAASSHSKGHISKHKSLSHHHTNKRTHYKTIHHHSSGKKKPTKKSKKSTKHSSKHLSKKHTKKHTTKHTKKHTTKHVVKHTTKHTTKHTSSNKKNTPNASSLTFPNHKVVAYVLDWDIPKNIKWDKLDHIAYAFAEPNANGVLKGFDGNNLKSVVTQAHKNKVGVSISIAGWSGSIHMSTLVGSVSKRNTFVRNIVNMVKKYKLDGVNIDWEFPNSPDSIANAARNPNDTANLLIFIKLLRQKLDTTFPKAHKVITVAASVGPFLDERGRSIRHFEPDWVTNVDYFYLMSYEYNGNWNDVAGPNAALWGSSHGWGVDTTVNLWYNAGIPKNKMHVGVTFYGKVLKTAQPITSTSGMYVKLDGHTQIKGDKYDESDADPCPNCKPSYTGEYQWRSIVANGILENKNGWTTYWDEQSQTPYAYHAGKHTFLSYDNTKSFEAKLNYVKSEGLAGFMIWSLEMDDSKHTLLNTLQGVRK